MNEDEKISKEFLTSKTSSTKKLVSVGLDLRTFGASGSDIISVTQCRGTGNCMKWQNEFDYLL